MDGWIWLTGRCPSSCGAPPGPAGGRPSPARSGTPAPRSPSPPPPPPGASSSLFFSDETEEYVGDETQKKVHSTASLSPRGLLCLRRCLPVPPLRPAGCGPLRYVRALNVDLPASLSQSHKSHGQGRKKKGTDMQRKLTLPLCSAHERNKLTHRGLGHNELRPRLAQAHNHTFATIW